MQTTSVSRSSALWTLAGLGIVFLLRTAYELLIPIVIAVLLSYALEPLVVYLRRLRIPRAWAAAILVAALTAGAAWTLYTMRSQLREAITSLPEAIGRISRWLGVDGQGPQTQNPTQSPEMLQHAARLLASGAGHATVVVFLLFFLLLSGDHFKRRLLELAGSHLKHRRITVEVLDDINRQIQRFLLVTAFTCAVVGLATWAVLAAIGVRQAIVWGFLAGVFNSIPYFGPVIISGGLLVVGLLQFGDPMAALKVSAASLAITSLEGWLLTPVLLGKTERMHVVVVFLGVLFWTWAWGGWGTVLAVPMMVVIKAICDHVDPLTPISRLMAP